MKIKLIVPVVEENARIPNLVLPIPAGPSPPDVETSFTDDLLTPIDLRKGLEDIYLVGITVLSKTALRTYEIADAYRKKGIPVVLGGIHPTALPEEAKGRAAISNSLMIAAIQTPDFSSSYSLSLPPWHKEWS